MLYKNLIISFLFVFSWTVTGASADGDAARGKALSIICADCHGSDGLGDEDVPAIAGMEAAVIRKELTDFKSGARIDEGEEMSEIAPDLSDQEITDLAAYFTTLSPK
jgi:cytochrome c553